MRWIIGDIHGMLRPLRTLLKALAGIDERPRLFFTGDYINRGPDSRGVVDLLLSLPDARFLRGNHDDIFSMIVNGAGYAPNAAEGDPLVAFQWFAQHGLDATFISYGADPAEVEQLAARPALDGLRRLADRIPESHRRFFANLEVAIEEPDLFVTHGRWDPHTPPEHLAQRAAADPVLRSAMLWGRYTECEVLGPKAWRRVGYFGHTPVDTYAFADNSALRPAVGPGIVLLDTGAALSVSGRLTAFCPDTSSFIQADHFGNLVEVER